MVCTKKVKTMYIHFVDNKGHAAISRNCFFLNIFSDHDRQAWNRLGKDVGDPRREKSKHLEDGGRVELVMNTYLTWLLNCWPCIVFITSDTHQHNTKQLQKKKKKQILLKRSLKIIYTANSDHNVHSRLSMLLEKNIIDYAKVDPDDIEAARKFAAPERENLKRNVRSALDSLISGLSVFDHLDHNLACWTKWQS